MRQAKVWIVAALGLVSMLFAAPVRAQPVDLAVELSEWRLTPTQIRVPPGEQVHIRLFNNGSIQHNFMIEDYANYDPLIPSGGQANVFFTAGTAGSFPMYCAVPGHRAMGMEGVFIINQTQTNPITPTPADLTTIIVVSVASVAAAAAVVVLLRLRRKPEGKA